MIMLRILYLSVVVFSLVVLNMFSTEIFRPSPVLYGEAFSEPGARFQTAQIQNQNSNKILSPKSCETITLFLFYS
jgi:hypothetical protein